MARATITLTVKVAWWVRPYLYSLVLMSRLTGLEPDLDKVEAVVLKGLRVRP